MPSKPSSSKPQLEGAQGRKAAKKQPLPTEDRLKRLFNSLCAQIDGGHFTNAVRTCDKSESPTSVSLVEHGADLRYSVLRLEPGNKDAIQAKIFVLLQTEQYQQALSLLGNASEYAFERAYLLYRLQRESEADEILDGIPAGEDGEDRGVLHLKAQMACRLSVSFCHWHDHN